MARRNVAHAGINYTIADDDAAPRDLRWWAVLRARVVDELTLRPPLGPILVSTTTPRCVPRVADDGICGLVARPRDASAAMLAPGGLTAEVGVDGYLPRSLTGAIDAARRDLTAAAVPPTRTLTVAPGDPLVVSGDSASRLQFRPGRGLLMERPVATDPDEFTLVDDPVVPPAATTVPLVDPVQAARPVRVPPWRVAGVPIVLADQPLHRARAAVLRGRALRQTTVGGVPGPVNPAQVLIGISGVWWTFPEIVGNSNPPHAPNLVSFAAPIAFDHTPGTAVERCTLGADPVVRSVRANAARGARELQLAPWTGVNPLNVAGGDVLEIELANSRERELVVTDAFTPPTSPALPATVRLRTPLAFPHHAGAIVAKRSVAAAPQGQVEREAQRGDHVLFVTSLATAGAAAVIVLRLEPGTPREELRFARRMPTYDSTAAPPDDYRYAVPVGDDGTFEFPPIARVAQIRIQAAHPGQAVMQPIDFAPDYLTDNTLQILFTP